jgi:hypothetical protein
MKNNLFQHLMDFHLSDMDLISVGDNQAAFLSWVDVVYRRILSKYPPNIASHLKLQKKFKLATFLCYERY